jgi:hypothetical protein
MQVDEVKSVRRTLITNVDEKEALAFAEAAFAAHQERMDAFAKKYGEPLAMAASELANLLNLGRLIGAHMGHTTIGLQVGECISQLCEAIMKMNPTVKAAEFQDDVLLIAHGLQNETPAGPKPPPH